MTFDLTNDKLQKIAVECVSEFMTKKASLSEAICKQASDLELNPDQIKRVIETTNTVAYLRQLEDAKDRTFEFPLADYKVVMAHLVIPEKRAEEECEEEKEDKPKKEAEKDEEKSEDSEKEESDEDKEDKDEAKDEDKEKANMQEKMAMLSKEVLRCQSILEKMAYDKISLAEELVAAAKLVASQPNAMEKVAEVVEVEDYPLILALCKLEKRAAESVVFTDKELLETRRMYSLYKQAEDIIATEYEMNDFLERAYNILEKRAGFFGAALSNFARAAGKFRSGATAVGSMPVGEAASKAANKIGSSFSSVGSGIASGAKAVGVGAPRLAGQAVGAAVGGVGRFAGNKISNVAVKGYGGAKVGIQRGAQHITNVAKQGIATHAPSIAGKMGIEKGFKAPKTFGQHAMGPIGTGAESGMGYTSYSKAYKDFRRVERKHGLDAAKAQFGGTSPNMLRVNTGRLASGAVAVGVTGLGATGINASREKHKVSDLMDE